MKISKWIFGYGSLIWKPNFPFDEKLIGYVKGFQRKFYQYSTYHRGNSANPGRVVTLMPSEEQTDKVFGVAYKINEKHAKKVLEMLDIRESGGYERITVTFQAREENRRPFEAMVYVAGKNNPGFAGPAEHGEIAEEILNAMGVSGTNVDYLLQLAQAMREIAPEVHDDHLFSIERRVLQINSEIQCDEE